MATQEFQAETKRLLDIVINSIYSNKEIFLRELISNASDAIDKLYYKSLTDNSLDFNKDDYYIKITVDKENRQLKISDTGIGMTRQELEDNIGVIARSGSLDFKKANEQEIKDGHDIIGQFGVGFYSAFMVAEEVTIISKAYGSDHAYKWESEGIEGYSVSPTEKESVGTDVILKIKENTDDEDYDQYLDEHRLKSIVKKYSDFIRYPIKMDLTKSKPKDDNEEEYEEYIEEETVNTMVPIWERNKNELTDEDYKNFYRERHYGFDEPITHIHINAEGTISFKAVLFIPERPPFNFYTKEFEKGLELYSNGVLIMNKCPDLLPDYFSFVRGVVDSEDLSLNISREMLQQDKQLKLIAKNIKNKVKKELKNVMENDREKYEEFFESFGTLLKYGIYSEFGQNKETLQDLLLFYSSKENKMVSLDEYISRMGEDQKYIYYATGESVERIDKLPQTEFVKDKGYEVLYLTEDVDEFAIKMMGSYQDVEFKSVSSKDLGLDSEDEETSDEKEKEYKGMFDKMAEILSDKVNTVRASERLKDHPVCLANEGEISIEMEKVLQSMPNNQNVQAEKALEINVNHDVFDKLTEAYEQDEDKFKLYTDLLYNQACLIEGLPIEDPVKYTNNVCKIMS
ncbi:molecular chaperone HtpG [Natranaerobius thermophilus]|uniref:Chaperone protein HtpG n=1 Tax=Natranaerobius thermophilus (strain ATCC BAA-1301 / DSM 18059 / JW/NM-WN-LF) TaxID=457570 RepID=HTPG_NATTJ|nr:molecular chaperone HtpG [Natranaerobius thermophilus]B2A875.1 RecName: Full=Chaperone protein HtpG; AltName: Full=Heat shock protein HtpG; AltName: Full=High temperature protein G [Natranaerobius thermophilus JW/NM-WN-LF]ACB84441.1 heat shock protein Hsp90 [Natranaerobius thermophilus JW/NM-WN-LF]